MMEKFKICPSCGAKNPPNRIECDQCEADITGVPVMTETQEEIVETKSKFVRICDCGAKNLPQARRCAVCGEDISDIPAVEETEAATESPGKIMLVSLDGSYAYELCEKELIIGRSHDMGEYLNGFPYVSRSQAKLYQQDGQLFLSNLSHSNPTYVNNHPLNIDRSVPLQDGDEIGLGGCVVDGKRQDQAAYLIVRFPQRRG